MKWQYEQIVLHCVCPMILHPKQHLFPAAIALCILGVMSLWSSTSPASLFTKEYVSTTVNIGIQHTYPAHIQFELSTKNTIGILDVSFIEGEDISVQISLPTEWERREVQGLQLDNIQFSESQFGYTTWTFPRDASMQFFLPAIPDSVLVHNPSTATLQLSLFKVSLKTNAVEENVLLVHIEPVLLW
jgi:hypothetical protein